MSVRKGGQLIAGSVDPDKYANISLTNSPYTTNRILEIPQDIKLELNNGTLTLKAGSKVYVPNGVEQDGTTLKFSSITVASDLSVSFLWGVSGETFVYYNVSGNALFIEHPNYNKGSGTTFVSDGTYYYTDSNYIRRMSDGSASYTLSFPFAKITISSDNKVTSIDQIFNGFGYIGSTVFVIKDGIKVQKPNGRNSDGTCLSSVVSHSGVITQTYTNTNDILFDVFVEEGQTFCLRSPAGENLYYDSERNLMIDAGLPSDRFVIGKAFFKGGKCYSVTSIATDSIANSNASNFSQAGRSYLSGLGMPSSRYIDLTLGASGSTYTAPANGYIYLGMTATAANQYVNINDGQGETHVQNANGAGNYLDRFVAFKKGDVGSITYNAGTLRTFRFYYAEGESNV